MGSSWKAESDEPCQYKPYSQESAYSQKHDNHPQTGNEPRTAANRFIEYFGKGDGEQYESDRQEKYARRKCGRAFISILNNGGNARADIKQAHQRQRARNNPHCIRNAEFHNGDLKPKNYRFHHDILHYLGFYDAAPGERARSGVGVIRQVISSRLIKVGGAIHPDYSGPCRIFRHGRTDVAESCLMTDLYS